MIYSMMFGPAAQSALPQLHILVRISWNGTAVNLRERAAIAVSARSPIERLKEYKQQRGLPNLPFLSDTSGDYTRTYVNAQDADVPGFSVFTRDNGTIRHFYSGEMSGDMADPGQDPRGAPDLDPLWSLLDRYRKVAARTGTQTRLRPQGLAVQAGAPFGANSAARFRCRLQARSPSFSERLIHSRATMYLTYIVLFQQTIVHGSKN